MSRTITIRRPDDWHVHFRDDAMMRAVVPATARHFARALVMPNTPAILTADDAAAYHSRIFRAAMAPTGLTRFRPMMTLKLTPRTTPAMIEAAAAMGIVKAAKLYPAGATTASDDGIVGFTGVVELAPVLAAMQDAGMVLCVHGEDPDAFVLDRESAYLGTVHWIVQHFPGLRVVLEHISTEKSVRFVEKASVNVAATITAHHLVDTLDDVIGGGLRPHAFCKPIPKRPEDRAALRRAAFRGRGSRFFFGSDSAPHLRHDKESGCGCAGVYSAPVALAVLAAVFLDGPIVAGDPRPHDRPGCLQAFVSENGADFYRVPRNEGTITLEERDWFVPPAYDVADGPGFVEVVPMRAGEKLGWRVKVEESSC